MTRRLRRFFLLTVCCAVASQSGGSIASAAPVGPVLDLSVMGDSNAVPGDTEFPFLLDLTNIGDAPTSGPPPTLKIKLAEGLTAVQMAANPTFEFSTSLWNCPGIEGATEFTCTLPLGLPYRRSGFPSFPTIFAPILLVEVDPTASGPLVSSFELSGGGAKPDVIYETTQATPEPAEFGVDAFDGEVLDAAAQPYTQAGGHPASASVSLDFTTEANPKPLIGPLWPVEPIKDVFVHVPPGLIGNPSAASQCTMEALSDIKAPLCDPSSQIGTADIRVNSLGLRPQKTISVYNMVPPPDAPARFGFNVLGNAVLLTAHLSNDGDWGISIDSTDISEGLGAAGSTVTLWGVPADPIHDFERACGGGEVVVANAGPVCPTDHPRVAFLRNPTACPDIHYGLTTTARIDSWEHPGDFRTASFESHLPPGYALPVERRGSFRGPTGCDAVPFTPSFSAQPTNSQADSPTGLNVDLSIPQSDDPDVISQSDLKKAVVTLPQGMTVNPASADGLDACTSSQIGLRGTDFPAPAPIRFTNTPANCPDKAKLGSIEIDTPLLDHTVKGAVYLAAQQDNPFHSLLALYITATDPETGVVLKLAGHVEARANGQLVTTFDNQPQLPFETLHLELFGGSRASLRTPSTCGTHTITAGLEPWSDPASSVDFDSSFQITEGPAGTPCPNGAFDPGFNAGTKDPIGGAFTPFHLRLTRADGTRELTGVSTTLSPGLLGKLAGVSQCSDAALAAISDDEGTGLAQLNSPSCPSSSQVGAATVGAGAGPAPFFVKAGKVYLAGPYKGAPYSLAVLTPAVAGPFDLGSVLVRTALRIDPVTTQITAISDALPTILHGIPLDLRDIRVDLDRPQFTLNPTSCDPMAIDATITGVGGASADRSNRFQVAECGKLGFKPKLSLRLKGGAKRTDHPRLIANLSARHGDANIARTQVTLPRAAFLDQSHIRTVCTRVQFAADACPKGSIYGRASATTPLLDYPLTGPVYLRSSEHKLPDLVLALRGPSSQPIEVDLAGRTDSVKGALRNTFEAVPDAPVSKFRLELFGGNRGLVVLSRNICAHPYRAKIQMDGQNGKTHDTTPALRTDCAKHGRKHRHRR